MTKKTPAARKFRSSPPPPHNFSNGPSLNDLHLLRKPRPRSSSARPAMHVWCLSSLLFLKYCKTDLCLAFTFVKR